jgi:adenylosuccinate lyase
LRPHARPQYGLIRRRVEVEVRWLQFLCERAPSPEVPRLSAASHKLLNHIVDGFSLVRAALRPLACLCGSACSVL